MSTRSKKLWWLVGGLAVIVLLAGSFVAYASYFTAHAAPRVSVAGESVMGDTREELAAKLQQRADAVIIELTIDGKSRTATLSELGYQVDVEKTVDAVFQASDSLEEKLTVLLGDTNIVPVVTQDPETAQKYLESLIKEVGQAAKDASVILDDAAGVFTATPATEGREIDESPVGEAAEQAAQRLADGSVELATFTVQPAVTTKQAEEIAEAAGKLIAVPVTVSGEITTIKATDAEKASWISITSADGKLQQPTINAQAVKEWVKASGESTNDKPQPGVRNINSRGDVVSVVSEALSGWEVTGTDKLAEKLVKSLEEGKAFDGKFDYKEVESDKWDERLIADGAENLAYQAAKGEKWIDVDLSNFTMSAYEGATIVLGPISMVPGAPATPTVTGTYSVYAKVPVQTMRGPNADGTRYETPDVPDILYFYEGYALHGAYWRSSFGYGGPGGSHGCVNLPLDAASTLYNWAEIGTKVVSHY